MTLQLFSILAYVLAFLNLIDSGLTTYLLQHWLFKEANPIMQYLLENWPFATMFVKLIGVTCICRWITKLYAELAPQSRNVYGLLLSAAVFVYTLTVLWEVYLIWYAYPLLV